MFAVSLCVCLSVYAVCLGGVRVCVHVCVSSLSCLRVGMFVLLCLFFFVLSFVRLSLVYIQMKKRVFLFLYSHSEEGRT